MNLLFSYTGRIGRGGWWLGYVLTMIIIAAIVGLGAYLVPWSEVMLRGPDGAPLMTADGSYRLDPSNAKLIPMWIASAIGLLLGIWISFAVHTKRLHDRGFSGWWVLLALIPFFGAIWMLITMGFFEGQQGPNQYGADPRGPIKA